ncbi:ATP-dependent DNA helicase PcrA [Photobacterium damselae subsp. piscicida]|uniref:DNA 3'-5' helicase n=4 Tax=Gammaproteobacteria TaxID=1236 RepID=A0A1V1V3L3_PHODP|nr:ATP-dependent helicase [Photobacterium damselae]MBE8128976.1 ATP-dependent helicase [Photobacterium damselae subsp. piscicida]PSV76128.1 ATP-dependent helicase [Photobacterium damselae]PSW78715.1 ATP-dependent helicase [Photobacterium damselae]QOD53659.1 ATP-dependent helicase [Photobacterium damselae subsp. piscicida]QOD57495.1 ATP-dependent helicase [Photobacterium damselae subsp. piscicida]
MSCFTPEQIAFIHHEQGNALCVAGAGTGKTTTLVGLIQHKLAQIPANNMLVLMFNRDIRNDFKQKLQGIGIEQQVPVHTFHSFCYQLLRHTGYLRETGYQVDFQQGESDKTLAKQVLRQMGAQEKSYQKQQTYKDPKTIELLMNFIGLVKAYMLPPKEVFDLSDISSEYQFIIEAFRNFETLRQERKLLFFDDWLVETVKLLQNNEAIRQYYHQQCRFIVVDEFQDINTAQYQLLKQLLGPQSQLVAVGDVDQCIYKWRGSAPQFMLNFERDFAPAKTYSLSRTFRFGHSLALAASHLISNNRNRFHDFQTVSHESVSDTQIEVVGSERQVGEIAQSIQQFLEQGGQAKDVAILVRRWSQTLLFELAFLTKKIPYQMPVPSVLGHSREVRLLMDILGFAIGRFEQQSPQQRSSFLFNIMAFPHCYVPNKDLKPLCDELANRPIEQWRAYVTKAEKIYSALNLDSFIDRVELLITLRRKGQFKALDVYRQYRKESQLDNWIWKTEATESEIEEAVERLDSVETVLESMDQHCEKALQYFEYYTQQSTHHDQHQAQQPNINGVQVTTIFRAKGCEFSQVYLPYWDKDAFPYMNRSSAGLAADTEEERRLAYVAMTRAKDAARVYYTVEPKKKESYVRANKNASQFVLESKVDVAQTVGEKLYQEGELPHHKSPIVYGYYQRLGRLDDMAQPPKEREIELPSSDGAYQQYSYEWALNQPLPENADKLIRTLMRTKKQKYFETELARLLREIQTVGSTKQKVLANRLIVVAKARSRML